MPQSTVPQRKDIPPEFTWNANSLFPSTEAWKAERAGIANDISTLSRFRGRLSDSPDGVAEALEALDGFRARLTRLFTYALMAHSVDTTDSTAAALFGEAQSLMGQVMAAGAFVEPELLAIGQATLNQWSDEKPRLRIYRHYLADLFRKQEHIRSAEVEELLGLLADPFSGAARTEEMLTSADFQFEPALSATGEKLPVTQGTLGKILASPDRAARRSAWEHYTDEYLAHKHTLASTLNTSLKQSVFNMRARRHASTLAASLFEFNIPESVFHNLIETFRKNLPTWHRYWRVRRKMLGVDALQPYDIWAPLTASKPVVPYPQAVDWICEGLAPLGEDYTRRLRNGCLAERWVDVYPNAGKTAGAFSCGGLGAPPFILMSYNDDLFSMSTLAHELGHSMHTLLASEHQPPVYAGYSLFAAEVASNFHQAMVRSYLFERHADPAFQINLVEEAMSNFHRYFFIMPTLARFELETHQRAERGQSLTADDLNSLMADLFSEAYGSEMSVDRERVGITWATFGHLYTDYYVYQYATGISGANALARRILSGAPNAVNDYLGFLKAGSSLYPLDALRQAGVDLTTPEPVEAAFQVLSGIVDRLEAQLVALADR